MIKKICFSISENLPEISKVIFSKQKTVYSIKSNEIIPMENTSCSSMLNITE